MFSLLLTQERILPLFFFRFFASHIILSLGQEESFSCVFPLRCSIRPTTTTTWRETVFFCRFFLDNTTIGLSSPQSGHKRHEKHKKKEGKSRKWCRKRRRRRRRRKRPHTHLNETLRLRKKEEAFIKDQQQQPAEKEREKKENKKKKNDRARAAKRSAQSAFDDDATRGVDGASPLLCTIESSSISDFLAPPKVGFRLGTNAGVEIDHVSLSFFALEMRALTTHLSLSLYSRARTRRERIFFATQLANNNTNRERLPPRRPRRTTPPTRTRTPSSNQASRGRKPVTTI